MDSWSRHIEKRKVSKQKSSLAYLCLAGLLGLVIGLLSSLPAFAVDNSICARVKLEIKQELTLERQAFDAHMRITNGFDHIGLEDVNVEVTFSDEEGNSVLASFDPKTPYFGPRFPLTYKANCPILLLSKSNVLSLGNSRGGGNTDGSELFQLRECLYR